MRALNPECYFDALGLLAEARPSVQPVSVIELHLFAYLARVISLNDAKPMNEWGYSFSVTNEGFPFSASLSAALEALERQSVIEIDGSGSIHPAEGVLLQEYKTLCNLGQLSPRKRYLVAAMDCALLMPAGSIRYAVSLSPGLRTAISRNQVSVLLSVDDVEEITDEYKMISNVMKSDFGDLLDPAIIWLTARVTRQVKADSVA